MISLLYSSYKIGAKVWKIPLRNSLDYGSTHVSWGPGPNSSHSHNFFPPSPVFLLPPGQHSQLHKSQTPSSYYLIFFKCPLSLLCKGENPRLLSVASKDCAIWPQLTSLWAFLMTQAIKNLPSMQETWVWSLGWEDPLEKGVASYSVILAWRIPWTEEPGRLYSNGVAKGQTWLSN